ncbi:MAG TPA: hypothetical protein VM661_03195 [Candidatus Sulfotelmatobacter sp.]|jgi:hypothetical protein|nr:hypothetical protein [Candidatus Sulfotelmatobacter sp.]
MAEMLLDHGMDEAEMLKGLGTVENVFSQAQKLGDGAIIVMTTFDPDNSSGHVVIVANDHGVVGAIEGQDWGNGKSAGVITDVKTAQKRYGDGKIVGMGIIKRGAQ